MELQDVQVLAEGLAFPEGPVAMGDGSVVVVEIVGGRLSRVPAGGGPVEVVAELGGGPNGAARGPDGAIYVCNNGGFPPAARVTPSIQRVDVDTGQVDVLYTELDGTPLVAPNDLVFDSSGGFWFTDHVRGAVGYASPDGRSIRQAASGLNGPNGIGLSPDERTLYWSHTSTRQVLRRRLDGPGEMVPSPGHDVIALMYGGGLDPESLLVGLPGAQELDSLAVDGAGHVCVGTLIDSGITAVSPDGATVEKYTLPDKLADRLVTNICFGGPDLCTAFVTLSETGRLISCRWPRPGHRLAFQER